MKPCRHSLLMVAALAMCPVTAPAQSVEHGERVAASFLLARGRAPSAAEAATWADLGPLPLADFMARHREQLRSDASEAQAVFARAGRDALGRPTDEAAAAARSDSVSTYTELMKRHLAWLAGHPAEYEQVIHRAYRLVLRREAYSLEIDYWRKQETLSHALLVGCIENWARRNQPGLMVTTGTATISVNSAFLTTVRLSPATAAEARAAAGLEVADATAALVFGRHLVAPGAGSVASNGSIHFVAAGGAALRPDLAAHP